MKKQIKLLGLTAMLLCSCGGNQTSATSNEDVSSQDSSVASTDETSSAQTSASDVSTDDLANPGNPTNIYDNRIQMSGVVAETADPFLLRYNGRYYLYPTTNGARQRCYVSEDLQTWEAVDNGTNTSGYCYEYTAGEEGVPESSTPFAPEVIYHDGYFYMISSPMGGGHYVFRSEAPEGPFECISGNLGRSIDGSFFIDSDEKIYCYGASSNCILGYEVEDDFITFSDSTTSLWNATIGNWNEGPYLLRRYGEYYLTYTGTHYLSPSYRVDYAYAPEGSTPLTNGDYTREKTVLLSTDEDFKALGHSMTVLSLDLDSYYIVYHNMQEDEGTNRFLNYSRLSFNGANMAVNSVKASNCVGADEPYFYAWDDTEFLSESGFLLSDLESGDTFSAEYNMAGKGRGVFSYLDGDNYSYFQFNGNSIDLVTVSSGAANTLTSISLSKTYSETALHSYRIQYKDGILAFYFDGIEKLYNFEATLNGGRVGYVLDSGYSQIGYTAYSNLAFGSSDKEYYSDTISLANGYVDSLSKLTGESGLKEVTSNSDYLMKGNKNLVLASNGDMATYRMYASEGDEYIIRARFPYSALGAKVGLMVDGVDQGIVTLPETEGFRKRGDSYLELGRVALTQGGHNITIYNPEADNSFSFSEITYEQNLATGQDLDLTLTDSSAYADLITRGSIYTTSTGISAESQNAVGLLTYEKYGDVEVSTNMTTTSIKSDGYAGVVLGVNNYSVNNSADADGGDSHLSFQGYFFGVNATGWFIYYIDFNFTLLLDYGSISGLGSSFTLIAEKRGDNLSFYIDSDLKGTYTNNLGPSLGQAGIWSHNADVTFQTMGIVALS